MIGGGCRPVCYVESGDAGKMSCVVRHKRTSVSNGSGGDHHVHVADGGAGLFERGADFGVISRTIFVPWLWRSEFEKKRNGVKNAFGALFMRTEEEFRCGYGRDADFMGMSLDKATKALIAAPNYETARVGVEHKRTVFHVKSGSGRDF